MRCAREVCARWTPDLRLFRRHARGVTFEEQWFCSVDCVEAEARERLERATVPSVGPARDRKASRLGALLLHSRSITPAALAAALDEQKTSGLRLGAQLCLMGATTRREVLRALATQFRVGFLPVVDPACVRNAPGGLSGDAIRALGVVPLEADEPRRQLKVACAAPLPRLALAVLRELTGCAIEPLLVDDEQLLALTRAYGTAQHAGAVQVTRTASLGDAAHHIAEAIRSGRARRVQPVRCEPWVWVRLEGDQAPEEIVLPVDAVPMAAVEAKEDTWPVAPTAH
jgi:hypothetical protein